MRAEDGYPEFTINDVGPEINLSKGLDSDGERSLAYQPHGNSSESNYFSQNYSSISSDSSSDSRRGNGPMNDCLNPSNTVNLVSSTANNPQNMEAPTSISDTIVIYPPTIIDMT